MPKLIGLWWNEMEAILTIIAIFFGWTILQIIFSASARTVGAVAKTAVGKGSLSENMGVAFNGLREFDVRLEDHRLGNETSGLEAKEVQCQGRFPVSRQMNVAFVTSIFDATAGDYEPVLSAMDELQEEDSIVFQHKAVVGHVSPNEGFASWIRAGAIIPDLLQPPYGGMRKLAVLLRLIDLDNPPAIQHGFHGTNADGIIWQKTVEFQHVFDGAGYKEEIETQDEVSSLTVTMAVAVAMADGTLHESEQDVIKNWVRRNIEPFGSERRNELKNIYNQAIREAYTAARTAKLDLTECLARIAQIADKPMKYEAIELCFDVMTADGEVSPSEMKVIKDAAFLLGLDFDELNIIRDKKLLEIEATTTNLGSIDDILGIDPSWDKATTRSHLRSEYQKWNNRLTTVPEGKERENCQKMLDMIAEARSRHG